MPLSYGDALDDASTQATDKVALLRSPVRYAAQAILAGAYIGVAVVVLASAAGPLAAASSPATKLVQGTVFGIALTLVVFAGAELFTSNNMTMLIGWLRGGISGAAAIAVNVAALAGNLVGSVLFALLVHAGGVLDTALPGKKPAGNAMIGSMVTSKLHATDGQLFARAVLCNMLVCLGIWMAMRTRNDVAKLITLFWVLFAFIASGFEHSVANMTIFSLAILNGDATWADLAHNLLLTVPGNIVGGAVVVALPYAFAVRRRVAGRATAGLATEPARSASSAAEPLATGEPVTPHA